MQPICEVNKCTGCGACQNVCMLNAIQMQFNKEGFINPIVDETKCVNCKQCISVCPVLNQCERNNPLYAFKGSSSSVEIRKQSSSGGIFSEIANRVLDDGGCVIGAFLDESFTVNHIVVDNQNCLDKLRGSKYIGSNTSDVFRQVKEHLRSGKLVLFSGTPCQIAGLKNYLKDMYINLITVDFICHGVASKSLFDMFIKDLEKQSDKKVKEFYFRTKARAYSSISCKINFEDDSQKILSWFRTSFGYAFSAGKINRESCASCQYADVRRVSDITLGDCIHDLSFTQKGKSIIDNCNLNISPIRLEEIIKNQTHLSAPQKAHAQRELIFRDMNKGYSDLERVYMTPPRRSLMKSLKARIKYAREKCNKS